MAHYLFWKMQFKGFATDHFSKISNNIIIPAYDSDAELPLLSKTIGEMPLALFLAFFFSSKTIKRSNSSTFKADTKNFIRNDCKKVNTVYIS